MKLLKHSIMLTILSLALGGEQANAATKQELIEAISVAGSTAIQLTREPPPSIGIYRPRAPDGRSTPVSLSYPALRNPADHRGSQTTTLVIASTH